MEKRTPSEKPVEGQVEGKNTHDDICSHVEPGICGFTCLIRACRLDKHTVAIQIEESECRQIKALSRQLTRISMRALFAPLTQNPVYAAAEQVGSHASCIVPSAVLKTAEVAMEMALPREVRIQIDKCPKNE